MKDNYFIIHGSFSSPFSNWIPYLRNEIANKELEVYTPDLPSGVGYQNYTNWENMMKEYVKLGLINENTTIFAHSVAPVFVCKFLINNKIKIKRLVSVCGFNNYLGINEEYDNVNESMYLDNLNEVKEYSNDIICYYSKNDPYVRYEVEKEFADTISTKQVVIDDGGHLNSESGYTEFEELLNCL
jgi:predicted alpha/beta hydrolase family esterase